ncbi:MAG TPA: hypothetical protein VNN07_09570 [Candidatus Tectomicrobia bacterium]|nr:hypothetical protein [Candidatus Tectomicrobia bacterium]
MSARRRRPSMLLVALGVLVAACASLPPARPIADMRQIAGTWTGRMTWSDGRTYDGVSTIRPDGTYEVELPELPPVRFAGAITVAGGEARYRSETTGRTGTISLHEEGDRRVLIWRADDGSSVARTTPLAGGRGR